MVVLNDGVVMWNLSRGGREFKEGHDYNKRDRTQPLCARPVREYAGSLGLTLRSCAMFQRRTGQSDMKNLLHQTSPANGNTECLNINR